MSELSSLNGSAKAGMTAFNETSNASKTNRPRLFDATLAPLLDQATDGAESIDDAAEDNESDDEQRAPASGAGMFAASVQPAQTRADVLVLPTSFGVADPAPSDGDGTVLRGISVTMDRPRMASEIFASGLTDDDFAHARSGWGQDAAGHEGGTSATSTPEVRASAPLDFPGLDDGALGTTASNAMPSDAAFIGSRLQRHELATDEGSMGKLLARSIDGAPKTDAVQASAQDPRAIEMPHDGAVRGLTDHARLDGIGRDLTARAPRDGVGRDLAVRATRDGVGRDLTARAPRERGASRSRAGIEDATKMQEVEPVPTDMSLAAAHVDTTFDPSRAASLIGTVSAPSAESAKTLTSATVPTSPSPLESVEGSAARAVRAAEVFGHKRALLGGEAHGQLVVPELGRVEVRAHVEGARVDVRVRAEEEHARVVIAANAPEMRAHVRVEVPNAVVRVDGSVPEFTGGNAFSGGFGRDADTTREPRERGDDATREKAPTQVKGARVRFVL